MAEMIFALPAGVSKIQYCINVILKEAKLEDVAVKQLFYTMLSMYSNDPRNAAITSPTGEGKNYIIHKVTDLFPKEDIIKYVGMTQKSIFHKNGILVIKNDNGEYEPIEISLVKLDEQIADKDHELNTTKDNNLRQALISQIKEIEKEQKDIRKNAKKLINLEHKCIIFLDTPPQELLNAIMSLLSHDEYETEYEFVDTSGGIKTKSNVLRGWPVVIFAQAVDYSHHKRWPEIRRRFTIVSPRMDKEKYAAAIDLIIDKNSMPDFMYQAQVVSDADKEQAREIIKSVKEKIVDISSSVEPGRNNVFIPFKDAIRKSLSATKSSDMTYADRIIKHLTLLAQVNVEDRPIIVFRKQGQVVPQKIPLATFSDLTDTLALMKSTTGVRQYVLEWYNDVFVKTYTDYPEPNTKVRDNKVISEDRRGVTTQQLAEATQKIKQKVLSTRQIRETYLDQLINEGYVDSKSSELDKKADIYYPVVINMIGDKENTTYIEKTSLFPPPFDIKSSIESLLDRRTTSDVLRIIPDMTIDEIVERYYNMGKGKGEDFLIDEERNSIKTSQDVQIDHNNSMEHAKEEENNFRDPHHDLLSNGVQNEEIKAKEGQTKEKKSPVDVFSYSPIRLSCESCGFVTISRFDFICHIEEERNISWEQAQQEVNKKEKGSDAASRFKERRTGRPREAEEEET